MGKRKRRNKVEETPSYDDIMHENEEKEEKNMNKKGLGKVIVAIGAALVAGGVAGYNVAKSKLKEGSSGESAETESDTFDPDPDMESEE